MQWGAIFHLVVSRNTQQLLHYQEYPFLVLRAILGKNGPVIK